jgi:hypothetical protein
MYSNEPKLGPLSLGLLKQLALPVCLNNARLVLL